MKIFKAGNAVRNTLFSVLLLIPLQLHIGYASTGNTEISNDTANTVEELPPSATPNVVLLSLETDENSKSTEIFLKKNKNTIDFLAKTFGIKSEYIVNDLMEINEKNTFVENNIGLLKNKNGKLKNFKSFEEGLIEYLYKFADNNKKLVSNKINPYSGKSSYVINLIKYFTTIYDNVDYLTAVSIGAAESGHYTVKSMLKYNNVYGGMSSKGLIKYKNIEYGVLSYIRLLSKNYYDKGLNTVESIGRVYCPRIENGKKVASSHWLSLVRANKNKYANTTNEITVEKLLNIK